MTALLAAVNMLLATVQADTFTMDYLRFGEGERTLVIIPGLSVQSVMNSAQAIAESYKLLTDDFTVYVFDRRKEVPPSYSIDDMARDTAEALKLLGLSRVCLFGASQGGMIAMKIAIDHPELVERMILGSTAASVTESRFSVIDEWIRLAKAGNAEGLYLSFGEAVYPPSVFEQSRELLTEAAATVTPDELKHFIILAEGTRGFNVISGLGKINCPVLVLGSNDDKVLGGDASRQIMEHLNGRADCEIFMYDGYGHAAYDVAPDYRERMLKFFAPSR